MDVPIVSNSRSNCKQFCQNTTPFPACTAPGATVPKNQKCKTIDFLRVFCDNKHGSRLHCLRDGERFPHSEGRGRIWRFPEWSSCHGCNQCGHRPPIFKKRLPGRGSCAVKRDSHNRRRSVHRQGCSLRFSFRCLFVYFLEYTV